jgi:hypothetical protein
MANKPTSQPTSGAPAEPEEQRYADEVVIRIPTFGRLMARWLPEPTVQHMRAAQREQLLALRSLLDEAIGRIDRAERRARAERPRREEILVE